MSHGAVKSAKNGSSSQAAETSREGSESLPPPPDGGWGWMVVFASFMIHIVSEYLSSLILLKKFYTYNNIFSIRYKVPVALTGKVKCNLKYRTA